MIVPLMMLVRVLLPAPLPPITVTKSPVLSIKVKLSIAIVSLAVPLLKDFLIFLNSIIFYSPVTAFGFFLKMPLPLRYLLKTYGPPMKTATTTAANIFSKSVSNPRKTTV